MAQVICEGYKNCKMLLKIYDLCDHSTPHEHSVSCGFQCLKCTSQGLRKDKLEKLKDVESNMYRI